MNRLGVAPVAGVLLLASACASSIASTHGSVEVEATGAAARFDSLADRYVDWYLADAPHRATALGIHKHDHAMFDFSSSAFSGRIAILRGWVDELQAIPRSELNTRRSFDHRILEYRLRAQLLEFEEVRSWRRNPNAYNRTLAASLSALADRKFASIETRLRAMTARMTAFGAAFSHARNNLRDVPPLWVELAVKSTTGTAKFLRDNLVAAVRADGFDGASPQIRTDFETARLAALDATESFIRWMQTELAPKARGDFRLGQDLFERKLLYEEHIAASCEELRDRNEAAIQRYQDWVAREAARIDANAPAATVMESVTSEFPPPDELIDTARALVRDAQAFVVDKGIIPLPTDKLPTIRPTPEYRRLSFASMSTPGPFEEQATEAYYNITNVDPSWDAERQRQHLTYFNYPGLLGISVHEAVPGHYTHGLYRKQSPSRLRKAFVPRSLSEGWAHYVEQMMVDEGFGGEDPKVRLGQLRRALQRHARWYAGVEMHCFGAKVEDVARRFMDIAYFAEFPALREVQRGTYDATYLYYAFGRIEILRMRAEQEHSLGDSFDPAEFHRRLLAEGLPLALHRDLLLESIPD